MEFRSQKTARIGLLAGISLTASLPGQSELRFDVRHDHWRGSGAAVLVVSEKGISFQEQNKKGEIEHQGEWPYGDIQELKVSPDTLTLRTYQAWKWRLGDDRRYRFTAVSGQSFDAVYPLLKDRLDQRFVAASAEKPTVTLWEIPVRLLGTFRNSEGVLLVGSDRVVFSTGRKRQSRTWRHQDIDNISTSGPFELTVTTFEPSIQHYGNRRAFNFRLKQPLDEGRFNELWRRLNQSKGLDFLTSFQGTPPNPAH